MFIRLVDAASGIITWRGLLLMNEENASVLTFGSTFIIFLSRLFLNCNPFSLSARTWKLGVLFDVQV